MNFILNKAFIVILTGIVLSSLLPAQTVQELVADRFTHYRYDDWISYGPALNITSIDMDDNYVYFASSGGGILRYDKYQNSWGFPFTTSNGLRSNRIYKVIFSADDRLLYAVTPAGTDVFRAAENFWQPAGPSVSLTPIRPSDAELEGLQNTREYHFPPYFRPANSFLPNFFTDAKLMYHPGGIIYDRYNREFKFTDRIVDNWQRVWIGSNGIGPLKGDLYNWRLESLPQSYPFISPRDIFIREDQFWLGGINQDSGPGGISRWDMNENSWQYFEAPFIPQLYQDDVTAIDGNDTYVIFATTDGVAVFTPAKDRWKTFNTQAGLEGDRVNDVLVRGDTVYVASEFGFNWIDLLAMKVFESNQTTLDHVTITQLTYKDSLVWAATRFGLFSIDITHDIIKNYPARAAMIDYDLTAIEAIGDELWMANKHGIACWDQQKDEWRSFTNLDLQFNVRDIAGTENCIWFATNKGLLKYDRSRNYWRLFTEKDGLISRDTYHIEPLDEYLWISTSEGITRFRWWRKDRID